MDKNYWAKDVSDYVENHPFLHTHVERRGMAHKRHCAAILGIEGPQGKTTLQNLLEQHGWKTRIFLDGEPYRGFAGANEMLCVFDFGTKLLRETQIIKYKENK